MGGLTVTFQIAKIVLYGQGDRRKVITLDVDKVNIIRGTSRTGKSALIPIIEYALGRGAFAVYEGKIADCVRAYALQLRFDGGTEVFVARQRPAGLGTKEMYLQVGVGSEPPSFEDLEPNSNTDGVNTQLGTLSGLAENLHRTPEGQTRRDLQATIDHALFLCFQHQTEIANNEVLFHRQAEPFIDRAIVDTLPFFLGATDQEELRLRDELNSAKRELSLAERSLREAELIVGEGAPAGEALLAQAEELQMVEHQPRPLDFDALLAALAQCLSWSPEAVPAERRPDSIALRERRLRLQEQYRTKSDQLEAAERYVTEYRQFSRQADRQRQRLESIGLFPGAQTLPRCPLCQSESPDSTAAVQAVNASITAIRRNLERTSQEVPRVERHIEKVRAEMRAIAQEIADVNVRIDSTVAVDRESRQVTDANLQKAHLAGKISLYLENVRLSSDLATLRDRQQRALAKVEAIESRLSAEVTEGRLETILEIIGAKMTRWATRLGLEHSQGAVRLDVKRLTVQVEKDGRFIPLSRVGSGENWVGYHVVTFLALHDWFVSRSRPVPRFMFLDQPSQVYFPGSRRREQDIDLDAVGNIYNLIFDVHSSWNNKFQFIVTDHADLENERYQSAIKHTWDPTNRLVPEDWPVVR